MKVIAITERGEDFAIAVVAVPEGQTGDATFLAWMRAGCEGGHSGYDTDGKSDDEISDMNTEYAFAELTVQGA